MTGEGTGSEDALSRTSAKKKRKKKPPQVPESEASVLSGMEKPSEEDEGEKTDEATKSVEGKVDEEEDEVEEEEEEGPTRKKPIKLLAPLDRNKYGKYIADYGNSENILYCFIWWTFEEIYEKMKYNIYDIRKRSCIICIHKYITKVLK